MKVYILGDYGEYGAENVVATLEKSEVMALAEENYGGFMDRPQYASGHPTMRETLTDLLGEDKAVREGTDLCFGWGGPQLYIIELEAGLIVHL